MTTYEKNKQTQRAVQISPKTYHELQAMKKMCGLPFNKLIDILMVAFKEIGFNKAINLYKENNKTRS